MYAWRARLLCSEDTTVNVPDFLFFLRVSRTRLTPRADDFAVHCSSNTAT
jgi:hypothetical protein